MLPEDEQRQLQEIEQGLYRDDPRFGRLMRAGDPQARYQRKLMRALLGGVIGVGLLIAGAVAEPAYLWAGMAVILVSLVWGGVSCRRYAAGGGCLRSRAATKAARGPRPRPGQGGWARMMERMEERWRRRQEGDRGAPGRTRS
jgi:hypothetical protein